MLLIGVWSLQRESGNTCYVTLARAKRGRKVNVSNLDVV